MGACGGPERAELILRELEQADEVGVGAEAAVPDADGELGTEACRDERVRCVVDDECRDRERLGVGRWAEDANVRDGREAGAEAAREMRVVGGDRRPSETLQLLRGGGEGERTEHVG